MSKNVDSGRRAFARLAGCRDRGTPRGTNTGRQFAAGAIFAGVLSAWSSGAADAVDASAPPAPVTSPAASLPPGAAAQIGAVGPAHYRPSRFSKQAGLHYSMVWGVDSLTVRWAESGEMIRFSYRVLDAEKAGPLNDERAKPLLLAPRAGVELVVPTMEKIGALRQSMKPEEGKSYWLAFSNKGRLVRRGDRVTVVIGGFRADGLVVD